MKPAPFEYAAPETLDEALSLLRENGDDAKPLAGGQSLVPLLNFRLARPAMLIDLNRVSGLAGILEIDGGLRIGAMTRQRALERSDAVSRIGPLIAEAVPHIAHPPIRNRGTLGGSIAHADPAAELPAVMLALDARFRAERAGGERWIDAADFFTGRFETAIETGELLTAIEVPAPAEVTGWAFNEVARRRGDRCLVGVAAVVHIDTGGLCDGARIVVMNAGSTPVVAVRAAESLIGAMPRAQRIADTATMAATNEIDPRGDVHASAQYRRHLADVLVRRALARAFERAADTAFRASGPP
jgi:CO/xanthine dehydrogenase FAD-binding subunit